MSSLKFPHSSGNAVSIAAPQDNPSSDRTLYLPSNADGTVLTNATPGCILQVVQSVKTDTFTSTADSFQDVSGLSAAITPSATSSKVLIELSLTYSGSDDSYCFGQLVRGSTAIDIGVADGNRERVSFTLNIPGSASSENKLFNLGYSYLDSPSTTSATTYKIQVRNYSGDTGRSYCINRTKVDSNVAYNFRGTSKIILTEVAG
tara:strand:+ start:72 stop:683 length:612 start_codon:yes stop_codon:yes gene_type:complete